jgi:predicted Rossmann fold flavoprotein
VSGESADIAIVGGGAAGLAAAIFAAEALPSPARVVILEAAPQPGTKILVSGGGRCNVTHQSVSPADFNGPRNIVKNVLAAFTVTHTIRWFASLGVELKEEETGKLFPVSDSARSVRDALTNRCRDLGVELRTHSRVSLIYTDGNAFTLDLPGQSLLAKRVILAGGGRSLPRSGTDGSAWQFARELGHTLTPTYQALVPLVLEPSMFHARLSGIAQDVELSTFAGGKRIDHSGGALLWTHFGISGPAVMDASRHWGTAHEQGLRPQLLCNLLPGESYESVEKRLLQTDRPRASVANTLATRLPQRVGDLLLQHLGIDGATQLAQLPRERRRALVQSLTALPLPVLRPRGWDYAEVTAGGVPLAEIDYRTMESRKTPRLYLAGEMLDCDGRIGGFNFQWAWATGHLAGRAAALSLHTSTSHGITA